MAPRDLPNEPARSLPPDHPAHSPSSPHSSVSIRPRNPVSPRPTIVLAALALVLALPIAGHASAPSPTTIATLVGRIAVPRGLPEEYRSGVLLLRDDLEGTLFSTLIELSRRQGGRAMLRQLLDSGFITVLVSERLRPMQAGLWGPIFSEGAVVGAALRIDLMQIRGLDHDPTGMETLAHELRHQVDAARAFSKIGTYDAVYRAASSGDRTRSAHRYAGRVRRQRPDMSSSEAERWLRPLVMALPEFRGELVADSSARRRDADGATSSQRER